MTDKPKIHVWIQCFRCGKQSLLKPPFVLVILPDAEIKCSECGTVWRIKGLVERELA